MIQEEELAAYVTAYELDERNAKLVNHRFNIPSNVLVTSQQGNVNSLPK